jgi:hypothetical protein
MGKSIWFGSAMVSMPTALANDLLAASRKVSSGRPAVKFIIEGYGNLSKYYIQAVHKINVTPMEFAALSKIAGLKGAAGNAVIAIGENEAGVFKRAEEQARARQTAELAAKAAKAPSIQIPAGGGKASSPPPSHKPGVSSSSGSPPIVQIGTTAQKPPPPDSYQPDSEFQPATPEDLEEAGEIIASGDSEGMSWVKIAAIGGGTLAAAGLLYFGYTKMRG